MSPALQDIVEVCAAWAVLVLAGGWTLDRLRERRAKRERGQS